MLFWQEKHLPQKNKIPAEAEMIVEERLLTYINSLDSGNTSFLDELEKEALENYVPIIRKDMQSFL